jgi:energy-coupling factor transporter ATP-binding protein EcfA2
MTDSGTAAVRTRPGNPFPGLRPFESHESALFFGRDEQCDALLTRLARGRLVAVVGMSGSGKTSLVRAGLLPALDRGYLPSAGSSWHIAIFRPGSDPVANLTRALVTRRRPSGVEQEDLDETRALLDASSLGLAAVARRLLRDRSECLLVVADQFEEIFRFSRIARSADAHVQATACVDLLINACEQDDVPVYVVLTMRSDYLGDCAHFTGLPEALNDSQFLVPRMTRAQLRAAIECPVAVGGGRISPRLVQRLLYEIDGTSSPDESRGDTGRQQDQDQLPVLQHALMRMWDVSRDARERGDPIDVTHYEQPPVETLRHALDRHAEEVYRALPTDHHRDVARLVFQQLTDRDAENREMRRPTPLHELTAVALRTAPDAVTPARAAIVDDVISAFAAEGRAFVVVNTQQDVDISHESFIRKWGRLRTWVEEESRSRRIYSKLAEAASSWARGEASLYRGPELAEARGWWQQQTPTPLWASRYHSGFEIAQRYLTKSVHGRRVRRALLFGNVALFVVAVMAIAVLMAVSRAEARRAEAAALEARNATASANGKLAEANRLFTQALEAQKQGRSSQAADLQRQAEQFEQQASAKSVLTPSELTELDRLRREESAWQRTEAALRQQLAAPKAGTQPTESTREMTGTDVAGLERLRKAESNWEQTQQQLSAATDRATKSQQAESALKKTNEELQTRLADALAAPARSVDAAATPDVSGIEQVLREFQAAYEKVDAAAVVKLWPSAPAAELTRNFSQFRSYAMEIIGPKITVTGDRAVVICVRKMSGEPKVGTHQSPRLVELVFRLRRAGGSWIIDAVEEQR